MEKIKVHIPVNLDGSRLDLALVATDTGLSRRKIRSIIDVGGCYINRKRVRIASRPVRAGDVVELEYNDRSLATLRKSEITLSESDILYQDADMIAINKPPGLPAQATRDQAVVHAEQALSKLLAARESKTTGKPILVHRLDKETSGVLLFALGEKAATHLTDLFREKKMQKTYLAVCAGIAKQKRFEVNCFLSPINRKTGSVEIVRAGGKSSHTLFEVFSENLERRVCLVRCHPTTGRSHQLRVHLASVDLPILGDKRYGGSILSVAQNEIKERTAAHHMLHAAKLEFTPRSEHRQILIEAPAPRDMLELISWLHLNSNSIQ